jgi:hypothetical protein
MGRKRWPDLSPNALCRLVTGMTPDEVENVVGRYHRPNLYEGRRYYAWIGEGGMLRAFFDGPDGTPSGAVLDVAEERRVLALSGNARSRLKNCTITRKWTCIPCRKLFRRPAIPALFCPTCGVACNRVPPGIQVPKPSRRQAWEAFWVQFKTEESLLDAYARGVLREDAKLEIMGIQLKAQVVTKRKRSR